MVESRSVDPLALLCNKAPAEGYRPSFCRRAVLFLPAWLLRFVLVTKRDIYSNSHADYVISA